MSTDKYDEACARMKRRFPTGEAQEKALIDAVAQTVIVDRLVPPRAMEFFPRDMDNICLRYVPQAGAASKLEVVSIHRHALNQLCQKVHFPMTYANQLNQYMAKPSLTSLTEEDWKRQLLCDNLNELFWQPEWADRNGSPTRFLHRIVGEELRGFLSRRYNRHLASAPLLRSFVDSCRHHDAKPLESIVSPVRVSLKYLLPHVFEVFPGEYVCIGSEWGNSDFGSGKTSVSQTVWRVLTGTSSVLDETFGRVHLGSIIEDSDIEMSDETAKKEVAALQSAIRDTVTVHFSESSVKRMLDALRAAHDAEVPWSRLKGQLSRFLSKGDLDFLQAALDTGESIIDLPPVTQIDNERRPNVYWAAAAVSALAAKTEDADQKRVLQNEAGKLLGMVMDQLDAGKSHGVKS